MFNAYRDILSYPGAAKFSTAAAIARLPMAMQALSVLFMISAIYKNYALAGQVNAVLVICFAIGNPIVASWTDQYGQAKVMRPITALYCTGVASLIWAVMTKQAPIYLFLIAAITGLCAGSFGAFVRSRWAKTLKDEPGKMNTAFALEAALDEILFIFGPTIATILGTSFHPTAGLMACLFGSFCGSFWFLSQTETEPEPRRHKDLDSDEKKSLLRSGSMFVLFIIYLVQGLTLGAIDLAVVAFCREIGQEALSGALIAVIGIGSLTSALIYGSRQWPLSPLRLFTAGILLMAVSLSAFYFVSDIWILTLLLLIFGTTYAPTMTNTINLLQLIVPSSRFTEGMAWFNTAYTIGASAGSWLGGVMIDRGGSQGGFMTIVVTSWLMILVVVASLPLLRNSLRRARARRQAKLDYHRKLEEAARQNQQKETDADESTNSVE